MWPCRLFKNNWIWLRGVDLNHRHLDYVPNDLPGCSTPHFDHSSAYSRGQTLACLSLGGGLRNLPADRRPVNSLQFDVNALLSAEVIHRLAASGDCAVVVHDDVAPRRHSGIK